MIVNGLLKSTTLQKAQIGGWALAYRAITTHPFEYFLENKERILKSNELLGSKNHDEEVCLDNSFLQ